MDQELMRLHLAELLDCLVWANPLSLAERRTRELAIEQHLHQAGLCWAELWQDLSDEAIALAIKRGIRWQEAFTELFVRRYLVLLGRWFYRWQADPELSKDLTQQLYVRFMENRLASYEPTRNFRAYLWQAARNQFLDVCRKARRSSSLASTIDLPDRSAGPDEIILERELSEKLELALNQLSVHEQRVLRGTLDGLSAEQIAQLLQVSRSRIFAWLFQARRKVEALLSLPSQTRPYHGRGSDQ